MINPPSLTSAVRRLASALHPLRVDRRAVTAIEYALIAGLIFLVIIVGVTHVGNAVLNNFNGVAAEM